MICDLSTAGTVMMNNIQYLKHEYTTESMKIKNSTRTLIVTVLESKNKYNLSSQTQFGMSRCFDDSNLLKQNNP